MPPPPRKRRLIQLLQLQDEGPTSDAQPQHHVGSPEALPQQQKEQESPAEETIGGDEADFMSDVFLIPDSNNQQNVSKRRRPRGPVSCDIRRPPSPIRNEQAQRQLGLSRHLMDPFQSFSSKEIQSGKDGTTVGKEMQENKAMRMMILMGYEPGKALGVQQEDIDHEKGHLEPVERNDSGDDQGEGLTKRNKEFSLLSNDLSDPNVSSRSTASSRLLEPLLPNISRLGSGLSARRGIGSTTPQSGPSLSSVISQAAQQHAREEARRAELDVELKEVHYRQRATLQAQEAHQSKLLHMARKTVWDLDTRMTTSSGAGAPGDGGDDNDDEEETGQQQRSDQSPAYSPLWLNESWFQVKSEDLPREIADLVEKAMGEEIITTTTTAQSGDQERAQLNGDDLPPSLSLPLPLPPTTTTTTTRREQTREFLSLPISTRLSITLDYLRTRHLYCLFCGVKYESNDQMQENCPGEEEEEHD